MRILVSGGGTGGHVYPALVVLAEIRRQDRAAEFLYLGRRGSIEERLTEHAKVPFRSIDAGGIRGMSAWTAGLNVMRLIQGTFQALDLVRSFKPNVIFATGGYVSVPVVWAGAIERVPSAIYLPDLEPGWAVRATARLATRIAISFPEVAQYFGRGKAIVTGYPVRPEFYAANRTRARQSLGLDPTARTVTLFGGSQGAHHINKAAVDNLVDLVRLTQVIHITGRNDEEWVKEHVQSLPNGMSGRVRVFGYLDEELPSALVAADLVVARAGAATLGEFPALGLPAVLVPFPFAGAHQERNAQFLVQRGAAVQVNNAALGIELVPTLRRLLESPGQLKRMGDSSRALGQPRAAANIAGLLKSMCEAKA